MASHDVEKARLRLPTAAAALVGAVAHVPVTGEHLREATYIGVLFVALEVTLVALAVLLVVADRPMVWAASVVVPVLAIAAYVASRSVGLPQIGDDVGRWTEPLGVVSVAAEAVMALLALVHHLPQARLGTGRATPAVLALVLLVAGLVATSQAAASSAGSDMPHEHGGHAATVGSSYWSEVAGGRTGGGVVRHYYVSADLVPWDYAPGGINVISRHPFDEDESAQVFVGGGPGRIGSRYTKCLYHGYSDASFHKRKARPASDAYLGMLGPVIRAEVGDTIKVVFRNTCSFPTSMHPHGVFYDKASEGAPYSDGTSGARKADDAVPPGGRHTYVWKVPGRAGPGPHDGSSVMWMYHSHTDEIADTYAGLLGPMVITARGMARPDGSPKDVDREIFASFFIDNETQSPLLAENMAKYGTPPMPADPDDDEEFVESNLKHSINGYLYGTMPMITVHRGQHVRWYVMSMGTEVDLHTPHWHGNDVVVSGMRMDVVSLLPAGMVVADMVPDDPGTWLFHCHVNDHIVAGMQTRYRVVG
jgi:FtsP/CotA-like multicopper oxidase with cupredoxin domain